MLKQFLLKKKRLTKFLDEKKEMYSMLVVAFLCDKILHLIIAILCGYCFGYFLFDKFRKKSQKEEIEDFFFFAYSQKYGQQRRRRRKFSFSV